MTVIGRYLPIIGPVAHRQIALEAGDEAIEFDRRFRTAAGEVGIGPRHQKGIGIGGEIGCSVTVQIDGNPAQETICVEIVGVKKRIFETKYQVAVGRAGRTEQVGIVDRLIAQVRSLAVRIPCLAEPADIVADLEIGERVGEIAFAVRREVPEILEREAVAAHAFDQAARTRPKVQRRQPPTLVEGQDIAVGVKNAAELRDGIEGKRDTGTGEDIIALVIEQLLLERRILVGRGREERPSGARQEAVRRCKARRAVPFAADRDVAAPVSEIHAVDAVDAIFRPRCESPVWTLSSRPSKSFFMMMLTVPAIASEP